MKKGISIHRGGSRSNASSLFIMPVAAIAVIFLVMQFYWAKENQHMFVPFSIERVICENCGSTGLKRNPREPEYLEVCPACNGVGGNHIRRMDTDDKICPACTGLGRVPEGDGWRSCRRCDGRGLIRSKSWIVRRNELQLIPSQTRTNANVR